MKFSAKKIAAALLGIICTGCLAGGLTACKAKGPIGMPEDATTYRLALPNDGSLPTAHTGLENIGYMAYALDRQSFYHAYAYCSSKAMGYTQITQTWKDYKDKVMICSDLTYSTFVSAGTQACFVNDEVYMRSSKKPGKSTTSTTAEWNTSRPTYYDRDTYLTKYGEFSTELSVYIINEDTIDSYGSVIVNDDGTYSQTFSLNSDAAYYYQYGMKTRGGLKGYPEFKRIEITFTFDSNWTVLSSYCEEKTKIAPSALGGISMDSTSCTTTTFDYGEQQFDNVHYGYFDSYYKQYIGNLTTEDEPETETPEPLTVLGSAFGGVVGGGEQFDLGLTVGETEYEGSVYMSLPDLSNVLDSLDVRLALGVKGSGKQDLFIDFAGGDVNAYYSDEFAMTLNIDAVSTIISQFSDWVSQFTNGGKSTVRYSLTDGDESEGFDLSSLLSSLNMEYDDTSVTISMVTDNLLGTGIGVELYLNFGRDISDNTYSFKSLELDSITYDSTSINLSAKITPDSTGSIISHDKSQTPANLADYATGVYSMLDSDTLKVNLNIDGSSNQVIEMLRGLSVHAEAYVALGCDLATRVDLEVSYKGLSAELSVYYDNNLTSKTYGEVYLHLTKVNGVELSAKVHCNIDDTVSAVKNLISVINGSVSTAALSDSESESASNSLATVINGILNLNFGEVIGDLYASNSQIRVSADVDAVIDALGVNVGGIKFGTAALALGLNNGSANLSLSLSALGLNLSVAGSDVQLNAPDKAEYFDVTELIGLVTRAADEVNYIIGEKSVAFTLDAYVVIDDVPMWVEGLGEVDWADGLKIALDVTLSIADGTSASLKDSVTLQLIYDESVSDDAPFVKFAVNGLGMQIYRSDLENTKRDFENIIDSVNLLMNGSKSGNASAETAVELYGANALSETADLGTAIEGILANENVQSILGAVLGFVKDLTVSLGVDVNDGSVASLLLQHALYGNLTLAANGGLSLAADITNANGTQICDVTAQITVGNGSAFGKVESDLGQCTLYSTAETDEAFVKIVYNYLFAVVEDLSISETLGDSTYEVKLLIDGAKSDIGALKDVYVEATLYYTQGLAGDRVKGDKLTEIELNIQIGSTVVGANVRYNNERIYLSLERLGTTVFDEIKFSASKDEIYSAVEQLVEIITNENVIKSLATFTNPASAGSVEIEDGISAQTESALTEVLDKVVTLDFANMISYRKVDGVNTATVNVDSVLALFGVNTGFSIGTVQVGINPQTHKVTGSVTCNDLTWATFSAEAAERRVYETGWQSGYIDIDFVSTLIGDLIKTAITDGELSTLYTLSGNISIGISYSVISATINIDNVKVTAGLDENNNFYFTLTGELQATSYAFQTVSQKWNIAITYSNGYITMGREVGTANAKYKVMTIDYLLAHLLDKNDSPIRWLLGTGATPWGLIASNVNLDLGSSHTKPQEYWLYQENVIVDDDEEQDTVIDFNEFKLSSIINGMKVVIGGEERSTFGNTGAISGSGDYYGFDLDLSSLIGNTLSNVYLTLLRSDEDGFTGVKVSTTAVGALKLNINLDQGISTNSADAQPDYFKLVDDAYSIDFNYFNGEKDPVTHITQTFGCFTYEGENSYASLDILGKVDLNVVGYGDLVPSQSVSLKSTSTVYLRDEANPVWVDDSHIIIFVDEDGNDLGTQMQITRDMTIFAKTAEAAEVTFDMGGVAENFSKIFGLDEQLERYDGDTGERTFLNWVDKDGKVVTSVKDVPLVNGTRTVYANYLATETYVNGVKYTLVSENGNLFYEVAEQGVALDSRYTTTLANGGEFLVLESEINGIPVTRMAVSALKGTNVKNVVVPETITEIRAQAFMDNYGIENVIFAADKVYLYGSSTSGNDRYVFFGCSTSDGGNSTILNVYYNEIESEGDWTTFRSGKRIGSDAGGALISNGAWTYVNYVQDGADLTNGLTCLNGGLILTAKAAEQIKAEVIAELNANTVSNGYINAYNVTVDNSITMNGKITTITVTVLDADNPYYLLTINSNQSGSIAMGEVEVYNGSRYVKAGSVVTLNPPEGYVFVSLTGIEHDGNTFVMTDYALTLEAECEKAPVTEYTLYSAVSFTMNGVEYSGGETLQVAEYPELGIPSAEGYLFIGWAYNNGKELEFVSGETIEYYNYYAIWAVARDEIASVVPVTSGTDPNAATVYCNTDVCDSFEGWYSSGDFTTKVTSLSSNEPLYARVNFTLTIVYSCKSNMIIFFNEKGTDEVQVNSSANYYEVKVSVLEGISISVNNKETNSKSYSITYGETFIAGDIRVKNVKSGIFGSSNSQVLTPDYPAGSAIDVNSNITITFRCEY